MITSSLHRVLFWFLTISSEAIVCVLVLVLSDNRSWVPRFRVPGSGLGTIPIEILLPWISFIIAVVVSVVRYLKKHDLGMG